MRSDYTQERFHNDRASEHAAQARTHIDTAKNMERAKKPERDKAPSARQIRDALKDQGDIKAAEAATADDTIHASEVIHCRASGSKLATDTWEQGKQVEFMYMPAGLHTINAGFRSGGINLTIEVDPVRDADICQASLDSLIKETPKQKAFGCFEHEEKTASVWANKFLPKDDGIFLAAEPSGAGADAVNKKNHRSWSPSFTTNAEYVKCECRKCDKGIRACACSAPSYFFPEGVRGSASNPAQITGVDFCVGTLTNKPAFRAIAPVKAKEVKEVPVVEAKATEVKPEHQEDDLDTIFSRVTPGETVDTILARIPGSVSSYAGELDAMDEIFKRLSNGDVK
jgi:hypothetical protein